MKYTYMSNFFINKSREYFLVFFTTIIFLLTLHSTCIADKNIFVVNEVKINVTRDLNFSRDKYIDQAFKNSFFILMSKILVSSDFNKIKDVKLKKIKSMIDSFQILQEKFSKNKYDAIYRVFYNEKKVKKLLIDKNISFSQPKDITAVFYPVLFVNGELQDFRKNYFYQQWKENDIENQSVNFILPIEDLDDLKKIKEIKNKIEDLDIEDIIKKYNTENYVFSLMQIEGKKLNVYLKTNFNNNKISKNFSYVLDKTDSPSELQKILIDLKMKSIDIWKNENIVNLAIPLSIKIKYETSNLKDLDKLKNSLPKIGIVEKYSMEEFNINYVFFKIDYYGSPKKLASELLNLGYNLKNNQGNWLIENE